MAEPEAETQDQAQAEPVPEPNTGTEGSEATDNEVGSKAEVPDEPQAEPAPEPDSAPDKDAAEASILAEKFSAEASINENLAEKLGTDPEAKLLGQSIDNISRNIGINDRFLIIRELFEGEAERFTSLVNELDNAENYEAASNILKQQLADHMDHEGVEILSGLLKRRYMR